MKTILHATTAAALMMAATVVTMAQIPAKGMSGRYVMQADSTDVPVAENDDFAQPDNIVPRIVVAELPVTALMPVVYTNFRDFSSYDPFSPELSGLSWLEWLERENATQNNAARLIQRYALANPDLVKYNLESLPSAPKRYVGKVDPKKYHIEIEEITPDLPGKMTVEVARRHWLRTFQSSLQFSQAYVSPNWYQGGNNNLNMLINVYYNVKLNTQYHPNLLFETTMQYKLGLNSAPDDSLRNYSISEDLLQLNTTFGFKAAKRWYYSISAQFKTQLLNSYNKNTYNLRSAFLSPAELNAGIGMTYNYVNPKKTFTFDASIAPISYNMKICTRSNNVLAHSTFNIDDDKSYAMQFGSTAELKLFWQMTKNISFRSRLFAFTDYNNIQGDWENTLNMEINRYLSTQVYAHVRYDSTTPRCDDPSWHKLQVKEILSFGISYRFSSI